MIKKLHGLDVASKKDEEDYRNIIFKNIDQDLAVIISSDNHNTTEYKIREKCWFKCKPTFEGLKRAIIQNKNRIYIGNEPPQMVAQRKNPSKFIKYISIKKKDDKEFDEKWFNSDIPLNQGLVSIIGSQGSGKSALLDIIALCGNSKDTKKFSFLNPDRFCNVDKKRHEFFEACLEFYDGTKNKVDSLEPIHSSEKETSISYIPQKYFVEICDEHNRAQFIRELKNIVYSNIPDEKRLEQDSFDNLFAYLQKSEISKRKKFIDDLQRMNQDIVKFEELISPEKKSEFQSELDKLNRELSSFKTPKEIKKSDGKNSVSLSKLDFSIDEKTNSIEVQNKIIKQTNRNIIDGESILSEIQETSQEIDNKIDHFVEVFKDLGIKLYSDNRDFKVNFSIGLKKITKYINDQRQIQSKSEKERSIVQEKLDSFKKQKDKIIQEFNEKEKSYQQYIEELREIKARRKEIFGDNITPGTIEYINNELRKIENQYPNQLLGFFKQREDLFKKIFKSIVDEKDILIDLSKYSQDKINNSEIIREKFKIEYGVKLSVRDFSEKLLDNIDIRKSAFSTVSSANININKKIAGLKITCKDKDLISFIDQVIDDIRGKKKLIDVLLDTNAITDFYNYLYSLEYIIPEYTLRLENRDISILSPGEKGALLIIHYLLVDNDKRPLLIDQPEQSLANDSVYKLLAPCFLKAKENRQIILATHNPNLAVNCDSEQIIIATINKNNNNEICYTSGAQEDIFINSEVLRILEGTKPAFQQRGEGYIELQK